MGGVIVVTDDQFKKTSFTLPESGVEVRKEKYGVLVRNADNFHQSLHFTHDEWFAFVKELRKVKFDD